MAENEIKTDEQMNVDGQMKADEQMNAGKSVPEIKMNRMSKRALKKRIKSYLIWFAVLFVLLLSFMFMLYLTGQQDNSFYEEGLTWTNTLWL